MTYEDVKNAASVLASAANYDVTSLGVENKARLYADILAVEAIFKGFKEAMKGDLVVIDKAELNSYGLTKNESVKYDYDFSGNRAYVAATKALEKATKALDKAKVKMPEYVALSSAQASFDEAFANLPEKKELEDAEKKLAGAKATAEQTKIGVTVTKTTTYILKRK
jgi:hypothetical protein